MNTLKVLLLGWVHRPPQSNRQTKNQFPLALLGIAQICSWGTLYYSFPQLAQAIIIEFGWPKSDVYLALTLCLVFSSFAAVPIGSFIDKGHGRKVMVTGSIMAGLLLISVSQVDSLLTLYFIFIGMGVVQAATLYDAAFSIINNNHQHEVAKGKIVTLTLWGGFASTLFIPLIEVLTTGYGWRVTFVILGAINLLLCTSIYMFLPDGQAQKAVQKQHAYKGHNVRWALKQPIFWALLICFSLFAAGASTFKFHVYPFLIEREFSPEEIVFMLAVMGPAQVLGRIVIKLVGTKITAMQMGIFTSATLPLTFFSMIYMPDNLWLFTCFIALFGIASGMMTIVKGIAIPELLTKEAYGVINGAMSLPITIVKASAPALAALLWAITLNYDLVLLVLGSISIIAALCFAIVKHLASFSS